MNLLNYLFERINTFKEHLEYLKFYYIDLTRYERHLVVVHKTFPRTKKTVVNVGENVLFNEGCSLTPKERLKQKKFQVKKDEDVMECEIVYDTSSERKLKEYENTHLSKCRNRWKSRTTFLMTEKEFVENEWIFLSRDFEEEFMLKNDHLFFGGCDKDVYERGVQKSSLYNITITQSDGEIVPYIVVMCGCKDMVLDYAQKYIHLTPVGERSVDEDRIDFLNPKSSLV